jgi:hypothetical protein
MILICTISIISGVVSAKANVEGVLLAQNETKYYIDFSEDLAKNKWTLANAQGGKDLVPKTLCVEKPRGNSESK